MKKRSKPITFWVVVDRDNYPYEISNKRYIARIRLGEAFRSVPCFAPFRIVKMAEVIREVKRK